MTPEREKFCIYLVEGHTQAEAYKLAFKPSKMTSSTLKVKACLLFSQAEIQKRYRELLNKIAEKHDWGIDRAAKELLDLITECKISDDRKILLNTIKELNELFQLKKEQSAEEKSNSALEELEKCLRRDFQ